LTAFIDLQLTQLELAITADTVKSPSEKIFCDILLFCEFLNFPRWEKEKMSTFLSFGRIRIRLVNACISLGDGVHESLVPQGFKRKSKDSPIDICTAGGVFNFLGV
jgi:hypothetical protein